MEGIANVHGMVLSLHLLKVLNSSRNFVDIMTSKNYMYSALININCLKTIHEQLQVSLGSHNMGVGTDF